MKKKCSWLMAVFLVPLMCCSQKEPKDDLPNDAKDSLIVLFNVKNSYSRMDIARVLKSVDSLGPKLIALEVIFDPIRNSEEDSILAATLASLDNVILSTELADPHLTIDKTNEFFKQRDFAEGVLSYLLEDDGTTIQYIPLFQNQHEQMLSFPDQIVFNFQPETLYRFDRLRVNKAVPIVYSKTHENFHIIDKESWSPELIEDKIIIFSPLGSGDDAFYIPFKNSKIQTYSSVITANIVLHILEEHKEHRRIIKN